MSNDRINIPKVTPGFRGAGGWYPTTDETGTRRIHLVCGGCGKHGGTMDNHEIRDNGDVHPSILCPRDGCGWHVWGHLENWQTEKKP